MRLHPVHWPPSQEAVGEQSLTRASNPHRLTTASDRVILTFAKLQRLSGLTKPSAVKAWLNREGVSYIRDNDGKPFTTLDALNRKLHRSQDDGFTLNDPQGGLPEKRTVVQGRPQQVGGANQGGRGASGVAQGIARGSSNFHPLHGDWTVGGLPALGGDQPSNEAGI